MISSSRSVHLRSLCVSASSSDTLVAGGSPKEDERQSKVSSKKEGDDSEDLKFWMDKTVADYDTIAWLEIAEAVTGKLNEQFG